MLLGIRTTLKQDLRCSPPELVYSITLQLPGTSTSFQSTMDITDYIQRLKSSMQRLHAVPPRQSHNWLVHITPDLLTLTHAFIRHDAVQKALQSPFNGSYRVINNTTKHFTVDVNGRHEVVSMDRLQPAYLDIQSPQPSLTSDNQSKSSPPMLAEHSTDIHSVPSSKSPTTTINPVPIVTTTCSGHRIHWPQHLNFLLFTSFSVGDYCSNWSSYSFNSIFQILFNTGTLELLF